MRAHCVVIASREFQVANRLAVDRENTAGRAEFRRHVAERCAIREWHMREAIAEKLDELANDALVAKHLGAGQNKVRRRRAFPQFAAQLEADNLRDQHGNRLPQHGGFSFDAADTPAKNAEAIDHRRVGVRADDRIRVGTANVPFLSVSKTTRLRYSRLTW